MPSAPVTCAGRVTCTKRELMFSGALNTKLWMSSGFAMRSVTNAPRPEVPLDPDLAMPGDQLYAECVANLAKELVATAEQLNRFVAVVESQSQGGVVHAGFRR